MNIENKKVKIGFILAAILTVCLTTIGSYAYFTASLSGNANANNTAITSAHMEITFTDGPEINTNYLIPGDYVEKTFTVENTGDQTTAYGIYFTNVFNNFANKDELVYELISEDGATVSQTECPGVDGTIKEGIAINPGETHHYTIKITFKETGENQDNNKAKTFSSIISVVKIYDSIRTETRLARRSFERVYIDDDSYSSLDEFKNNNSFYLKQNVTKVIGTKTSDYYVFEGDFLSNGATLDDLENCNSHYSQHNGNCYEKDGNVWIHFVSEDFDNLSDCEQNYYNYNDENGELTVPADEDRYGECKKVSGVNREVVISQTGDHSTSELCLYNKSTSNEVCINEVIHFSSKYNPSEEEKIEIYNEEMAMYNKLKNKLNITCRVKNNKMECITSDNQLLIFTGNSVDGQGNKAAVGQWHDQYLLYVERVEFNNLSECFAYTSNYSSGYSHCMLENDKIYLYHSNSSYSNWSGQPYNLYSTLQDCESACSSNSDECYCVKSYEPSFQQNRGECIYKEDISYCDQYQTM